MSKKTIIIGNRTIIIGNRTIVLDQKTENPTPIEHFVEELSIPAGIYCLSWVNKYSKYPGRKDEFVFQYFATEEQALESARIHYLYGGEDDDELRLTKSTNQNENIKSNTFFWDIIEMDFSHLKDKRLSKAQREDNINKFFGIENKETD